MISAKTIKAVVIGVSSGIIVSLFLGVNDFANKRIERQDQIKYLVQEITMYREFISNAEARYHRRAKREIQRRELQKAYYDNMRQKLEEALQNNASRLSFEEIKELRDVFLFIDSLPPNGFDDERYNYIFERLKSIKWLKLPPRTI